MSPGFEFRGSRPSFAARCCMWQPCITCASSESHLARHFSKSAPAASRFPPSLFPHRALISGQKSKCASCLEKQQPAATLAHISYRCDSLRTSITHTTQTARLPARPPPSTPKLSAPTNISNNYSNRHPTSLHPSIFSTHHQRYHHASTSHKILLPETHPFAHVRHGPRDAPMGQPRAMRPVLRLHHLGPTGLWHVRNDVVRHPGM